MSFIVILSCINTSRYGSLSLYHDETFLVNSPLNKASSVYFGKAASSLFSNSDTLLRGKKLKTNAIEKKAMLIKTMYTAEYFFELSLVIYVIDIVIV